MKVENEKLRMEVENLKKFIPNNSGLSNVITNAVSPSPSFKKRKMNDNLIMHSFQTPPHDPRRDSAPKIIVTPPESNLLPFDPFEPPEEGLYTISSTHNLTFEGESQDDFDFIPLNDTPVKSKKEEKKKEKKEEKLEKERKEKEKREKERREKEKKEKEEKELSKKNSKKRTFLEKLSGKAKEKDVSQDSPINSAQNYGPQNSAQRAQRKLVSHDEWEDDEEIVESPPKKAKKNNGASVAVRNQKSSKNTVPNTPIAFKTRSHQKQK